MYRTKMCIVRCITVIHIILFSLIFQNLNISLPLCYFCKFLQAFARFTACSTFLRYNFSGTINTIGRFHVRISTTFIFSISLISTSISLSLFNIPAKARVPGGDFISYTGWWLDDVPNQCKVVSVMVGARENLYWDSVSVPELSSILQ